MSCRVVVVLGGEGGCGLLQKGLFDDNAAAVEAGVSGAVVLLVEVFEERARRA